jgi:FkbM family methyltransferase
MPRVSVVVPIYNVERYLRECLESIAIQRVDLEVIMVDDGSTDGSTEIAEEFVARDPRFRLIRRPNGGLGAARNTGIDAATGEFICFVDSDDMLTPDAYELLVATLDQTGSDFATGNVDRLRDGQRARWSIPERAFERTRLKTHVTRCKPLLTDRTPWNKLFRRSFWDENGLRFPEGVRNEEIPVMLPAHALARSVDVIADVVYLWRVRTEGPLSGTQRRLEPHAIRRRLEAMQEVRDFFTARGLHTLRRWYDETVVTDDFRYYIDDFEPVDEDTRNFCMDCVEAYVESGTPGVIDRLPPLLRLKWHLARKRLWPELFELLRFEQEDLDGARPVRVGRRWYADYPFRGDPRLEIPASVYAYSPRYVMHRLLEGDHRGAARAIGRAVRGRVPSGRTGATPRRGSSDEQRANPISGNAVHDAIAAATASVLGVIDRHWGSDLYYAQQLSRRIAARAVSGRKDRARVLLAGLLFGTRHWSRTVVLNLDAPDGKVPFAIPDYAAFKVLGQMFYDGEYDVDLPEPPATVLDLGGHIGVSCLFFRRKWPSSRILTVEPNPALFPMLVHNVTPLGVEARYAAVADQPGTVEFLPSDLSWGGKTRPTDNGDAQVPAVTLDSLLDQPVDLLKLDVEGAELTAIPAATRLGNARAIVGEIHAPISAPEARVVVEALERAGFGVSCRPLTRFTIFRALRRQSANVGT